jgi:ribosomal protein S18 acetylase RimI-like enzyme
MTADSTTAGSTVRVSYLELRTDPRPAIERAGAERICLERLARAEYLTLYRRVGTAVRWDQRLQMPADDLDVLLSGTQLAIYVLRSANGETIGFCEFDRGAFPEVELKNFGVAPEAQGRGLGSWLLSVALNQEWTSRPARIWLHTDDWDHPAAIRLYQRAGLRLYAVREQPAGPL